MSGLGSFALLKKLKNRIGRTFQRHGTRLKHRLSPRARRRYRLESLVGPIGFWDELRQYQIRFLQSAGLLPHHSLLDIGCGPLQGGIPLIDYLDKQRYVGIDALEEPLNVAHELVAEHQLAGKNPQLLHSRTFGAEELSGRKFDYIWTSQLLYHLDATLLKALLVQVATFLNHNSVFYGDIFLEHPAHNWWYKAGKTWRGYNYHFHTAESVSRLADPYGLQVEDIGSLEQHGYPKQVSTYTNRMLRITTRR